MADNSAAIWGYLMPKIGNEYGVAGLMGNLQAESGLIPNNLQNSFEKKLGYTDETYTAAVDNGTYSRSSFINDSAGYGLAQWTYSTRKKRLYDKCKGEGYSSIGSLSLALDFLWWELENSYSGVLSVLKTATSVLEASNKVLFDFENPANQSEDVQKARADMGQAWYNKYTGTSGSELPEETPGGSTVNTGSKMDLLMIILATRGGNRVV